MKENFSGTVRETISPSRAVRGEELRLPDRVQDPVQSLSTSARKLKDRLSSDKVDGIWGDRHHPFDDGVLIIRALNGAMSPFGFRSLP